MHTAWTGSAHGQQDRGRKVTAMHWSLALLVAACCAARAAADGVVPAFVCATTEPHPHVQVRGCQQTDCSSRRSKGVAERTVSAHHCCRCTALPRFRQSVKLCGMCLTGSCGELILTVQISKGRSAVSRLQPSDHPGRMARHLSGALTHHSAYWLRLTPKPRTMCGH